MLRGNFLSTNQKHYQDLGSARHQHGISALVTQTSFCEGSSGDLAKRRLFSPATKEVPQKLSLEWSHLRISSTDVKVRTTFYSIIAVPQERTHRTAQ